MATGPSFPPKRARLDCILDCCEKDPDAKLTSPQDFGSWKTLLRAAEIRKHISILDLAKNLTEGEIPTVQYHRKCRIMFTMKKSLDLLVKKEKSQNESLISHASKQTDRRPSFINVSRVYDSKCIFCQKDKYLKGKDTRESLVLCKELRADKTIREAAIRKLDNIVLGLLSRELVAAERHYHRSCYRDYTRPEQGQSRASSAGIDNENDNPAMQYDDAVRQSKRELFSFIRNELFSKPDVMPMTDLMSKLTEKLASHGFKDVKLSTKKNLRRALESEFGETLHFVNDKNGRLLVFPASLTIDQLVKEYYAVREELNVMKSKN